MKKLNYFLTFVAGTMMMASCSNDAEVVSTVDDNAVQQIVLQVASNGDGLTTRAGRPLLSEEAAQNIDKVKVIITEKTTGNLVYTHVIDNWMTDGVVTPYSTGGHGRQTSFKLVDGEDGKKLEKNKVYSIYAFGYSNGSEYSDLLTKIDGVKYGTTTTFSENVLLTYSSTTSKAEEIFAGKLADVEVESNGGLTKTVVLNRQVAGTYGYFNNIPYVEGMDENTTLTLYASSKLNNQLVLGNFNSEDLTGNGTGNDDYVKYVVNGANSGAETGTIVYKIKLSDWFVTFANDGNGHLKVKGDEGDTNTYWKKPEAYKEVGLVKGSVFAGTFMIPLAANGSQTLTLKLENGDKALKYWNINLNQTIDYTVSVWGDNAFADATTVDTKKAYSIVRNHLYAVGKKLKAKPNTTNPEDPDPDDEDDDEDPEDLSMSQDLTVRVNDNWEVIHKMELE